MNFFIETGMIIETRDPTFFILDSCKNIIEVFPSRNP